MKLFKIMLFISSISMMVILNGCTNDVSEESVPVEITAEYESSDIGYTATDSEIPETKSIEEIKESIMETAVADEITAEDYKNAKDIEDIMKKIIAKTN